MLLKNSHLKFYSVFLKNQVGGIVANKKKSGLKHTFKFYSVFLKNQVGGIVANKKKSGLKHTFKFHLHQKPTPRLAQFRTSYL
jgi:hypothetical protein